MTTVLRCDNCSHICHDSALAVSFPDIPKLLERIAPGEPVPYGECPECGALIHKITPIEGKRAFIGVEDGKFEITLSTDTESFSQRKPDIITDDPEAARAFLVQARVGDIMASSSVDFPEEYRMEQAKVDQLFNR